MTEKTIHTYSRIDAGIVAIHLLSTEERGTMLQQEKTGLQNRIFVGTTDDFPPGSPVRIDINVPEKGIFQLNCVTEWSSGTDSGDKEQGIGLRLLDMIEMIDIGDDDSGTHSSDTSTMTGPESQKPSANISTSGPAAEATTLLPDATAISDLLGNLLDMNVRVDSGYPLEIDPLIPTAICTFNLDNGRIKTLWICDLAMIINIGAGLAVIPPEVAMKNIDLCEIPDNIRENFQEVLNVSASMFNRPDGPHLSIGTLVITPDPIPDDIQKALSAEKNRIDLRAIIPDYGEGNMSLIETNAH